MLRPTGDSVRELNTPGQPLCYDLFLQIRRIRARRWNGGKRDPRFSSAQSRTSALGFTTHDHGTTSQQQFKDPPLPQCSTTHSNRTQAQVMSLSLVLHKL